jgi:prepilin-type N-terminal cleavage/methylation domain-containing protein
MQKKKNFTLIELLIVIAIIAILMGILLPTMNMVRESAKKHKAKAEMNALVTAIKQYEAAYGILPVFGGAQNIDLTNYRILLEYLTCVDGPNGSGVTPNKRRTVFLDVPASYGTDTTAAEETTTSADQGDFKDPWNNIYQVRIDHDYDNEVTSPTTLKGKVFIYSRGPDRADNSGDGDDICSWK